jgi:hypothetical protein
MLPPPLFLKHYFDLAFLCTPQQHAAFEKLVQSYITVNSTFEASHFCVVIASTTTELELHYKHATQCSSHMHAE